MVKRIGYVSAHKTKKAAERQAKGMFSAKVIKTPKKLQKIAKGKPFTVAIEY